MRFQKQYYIGLLIWLLVSNSAMAQGTLTLSQAIQTAISNNLQLQVAQNESEIAHNNNYPGNAGMMPQVTFNASDNPSLANINQKFTNGTTIERNNVFSNNIGANVTAVYTLFDGNKMYATKRKLEAADIAGRNKLRAQMQTIIGNVVQSYSNIIRQKKYLEVLQQLNTLSEQRLSIVEVRQAAGLANNTDLYLAKLDLEARKQSILAQNALIANAYTDLNLLMNIKPDSIYNIESFMLSSKPVVKAELDSMLNANPELMLSENQVEIAMQTQKEIAAARMPNIRLTGAYNYSLQQSQAGFSLYNQSMGPQAGLLLSVPLFTGSINANNYRNAGLNLENARLQQQQTLQNIRGSYAMAWQNYSAAKLQIQSDSAALIIAKDYMDLMQARFKAGQNTIIELKEAQRSYEEIQYRYISNQYILKLAETQLLALTGQLTGN